ncbi:DUF6634 family protein (plasmid) [Thalassobaculum sp. OXR-137]|uniref:DUF6634 family protein n=1 Tax=Thalassobaculum sp. OXR-137 TaxID=3100173 RepID=UPI002AC9B2D3|nr:DUF6634 family protein [Thalassobaculum sp. OXR-137]WPZ37263.1 DUF6634 family protein [Thalassobaculum sp. OXR-137]
MKPSQKNRYRYEIEVFERLLGDLKAIAAGGGPTETELAAAPILDLYEVSTLSLPSLAGQVDGKPVDSSESTGAHLLMLHAPKLGWARTRSGYYRLGVPADRK